MYRNSERQRKASSIISRTNSITVSLTESPLFIVPHLVNPLVWSNLITPGLCQRSRHKYPMDFFSCDSCPATKLDLPQNFIISCFYVLLRNLNMLVCSRPLFLLLAGLIFSPSWWLWSSLPPPFLASFIPPLSACNHTLWQTCRSVKRHCN